MKAIRSDNRGEYENNKVEEFCIERGINHELTNTFTLEQNGTVEVYNQTVVDGARTMLKESGLDLNFWPEAVLWFTYTWNCICHRNQTKTHFELFGSTKPSIRYLKPFGCLVYVEIPLQKWSKLDSKANRGFLVGYAFLTKR